jgi:hypothetical protein
MQPKIAKIKNHKRSERRRVMLKIRAIAIRRGLPMPEKIKAPDGVGASLRDRPAAVARDRKEARRLELLHCRHRLPQCLHCDEPDADAPYDITSVHPNPLERPKNYSFGKLRPARSRARGAVAP